VSPKNLLYLQGTLLQKCKTIRNLIMATVNLYLKKPNADEDTLIYISIFHDGKRIKISSGESINPKYWLIEKKQVSKAYQGSTELNDELNTMKADVEAIIREAKSLHLEITSEYIKQKFNEIYKKEKTSKDFFDYYDVFLETGKSTKKPSVIQGYRANKKHLLDFEKYTNSKITFDKMDMNFYDRFIEYLISQCGFMNNSVGNHVKKIKAFLNFAKERGINTFTAYSKFKVFKEASQKISLTEDDLRKIIDVDLSNNRTLSRGRDLFLIQCFTALRYSDLVKLKPENFKGNFIIIQVQKTKTDLTIPIIPRLQNILKNFQDKNFKVTNKDLNKYLKEIGWRAGVNEPTESVHYQAGKRIEITVPKYELITTHTGRRTFVTLSSERGMRSEVTKRITGHKDKGSFDIYIKLSDKALYEEMMRVWGDF
jgi:site-specific recombinase XerD